MTFKVYKILSSYLRVLALLIAGSLGTISSAQFIENKGQLDSKILYTKPIVSGNVLISEQGISYLFYDDSKFRELYEKSHHIENTNPKLFKNQSNDDPLVIKYHSIEQQFVGGKIDSRNITGSREQVTKYNYFLGNDKTKWASDVRLFDKLLVKELYPNIDLELLSNGIELKYNFICRPGSNPALIKIQYKGADDIQLDGNSLNIKTSIIEYSETIPVSYLVSKANTSETVSVTMKLEGNTLSFTNIPSNFVNSNSTLVIDPLLIFSTYSGTTADNFGFTATYDEDGNMYAGGITTMAYRSIPNGKYPTTPGAFQSEYAGGSGRGNSADYTFPCDITISKYSPDGKQLIYATYIGGAHNEYPHSIVVDKSGNLIILGTTFSYNYPTTDFSYSNLKAGDVDIIVTKLSADGNSLIGSTFYGGTGRDGLNESENTKIFYADNYRGDVICDDDGNIFGVISTKSSDIEIKGGFKKENTSNVQQGLIFKFSQNVSQLLWSSYIGGNFNTSAYSIDFDQKGDIYVSGGIAGGGLANTAGTVNPDFLGGQADGYIAKISRDGKSLLKATYFGSDQYDQIMSLELDDAGFVYVVGQTDGVIPVKGGGYNLGNVGQFVTMLSPDLTKVISSGTFGRGDNKPDITINAFMVAQCKGIFVSGWGGGASTFKGSSTKDLPITEDAFQKTTDGSDFYIIVFSKEIKKVVYATYFGGNKTKDHVDGGTSRFDKKGVIYQSVCSSCPMDQQVGPISDFPTTSGAFAEKNISPRCSNAAFKFDAQSKNTRPVLRDTFITLEVFDTLNFNYLIWDPDGDTINITFNSLQKEETKFIKFPATASSIIGVSASKFSLSPVCKDAGKDTFVIRADVQDHGCPDHKSNTGFIKVLVTPPPAIKPPETVCLVFKENDYLEISWSAIPSSKYYKYTVLYKIFPNGQTVVLDTFYNTNEFKLLDKDVIKPRQKNYSYYLKVVNICESGGELSYKVSSIKESDSPVDPTTVITATVINNKDVSVQWLPSYEPDFGTFSLFRSKNTDTLHFEYLKDYANWNDTNYIDQSYDVQSQSYCFLLVVNDKCGLISPKSNIGCNIVLKGESKPFYHVLDWAPYRHWSAGISEYVLERSVDTGLLRPVVSVVSNQLNYDDHELDYDWGGYWYSIVAHENFKGFGATSRSNNVYLIQPPLLHVPNAFTKNHDGINETWGFVPVFVKTYHMQVYTRWGEKVFDSNDKHKDWDGSYYTESHGQEVFVWQVTYTGWDRSTHYQRGTVTVIK